MSDYGAFLASKRLIVPNCGIEVEPERLNPHLFPFQAALVQWSLRKGRSACFASTGLGKTRIQLAWAEHAAERTLVLAPLAVAQQTVREGERIGIPATYARRQEQAAERGITVTNYEMLNHFEPDQFGAVVLDESSLLKDVSSVTRGKLIEAFRHTPYRLCASATPAPNSIDEIANHAAFLGIMTRQEMIATFFVNRSAGKELQLKRHGKEAFYRWLASWGMSLTHPRDLGFLQEGYDLPPLSIEPVFVDTDYTPPGRLFADRLSGVVEVAAVRRNTLRGRCEAALDLIAKEPGEQWLIWTGLNDESEWMARHLPEGVEIQGSDDPDVKAERLLAFADGRVPYLVTKPGIAGHGLNLQSCARMVFVGLSYSYEAYFQCIRRCWRFGQTRPVKVYIVLSELEREIYETVLQKEKQANEMTHELIKHVAEFEKNELTAAAMRQEVTTETARGIDWTLHLGDSAAVLKEIRENSVDLITTSVPFSSLYTYSNLTEDLGNNRSDEEFFAHLSFVTRELYRVLKPGRLAAIHCQQLTTTKTTHGVMGMKDFRGDVIRHFMAHDWILHGEVTVDKDPQAVACRTKKTSLMFVTMRRDRTALSPVFVDYLLLFRKPGENGVRVRDEDGQTVSEEDWIQWARGVWYGVEETNVLNVNGARADDDERHLCPMSLDTIERCVRLYSNPGELVLDPFAGIGSTLYQAVLLGRRGVGVELKESYFRTAVGNLKRAESQASEPCLFTAEELLPVEQAG